MLLRGPLCGIHAKPVIRLRAADACLGPYQPWPLGPVIGDSRRMRTVGISCDNNPVSQPKSRRRPLSKLADAVDFLSESNTAPRTTNQENRGRWNPTFLQLEVTDHQNNMRHPPTYGNGEIHPDACGNPHCCHLPL